MDTSELEAAYRSVLDLAARGPGPGSPGAGDGDVWGPDEVLAHLGNQEEHDSSLPR